jgi:Ca-activated chloride channel family protein
VKVQVEFNPAQVGAYRLIGYEKRLLATQDFADDAKDAGEIGAGHTVTALYEVAPRGAEPAAPPVDPLKYQPVVGPVDQAWFSSAEMLTVAVRYKEPEADRSERLEFPLTDLGARYENASPDLKFQAAVAAFGMLLRRSPYAGNASFDAVVEWAGEGIGDDPNGYRREFVDLVGRAKALANGTR